MFNGKKILITGGTGSFGHQILQRLVDLHPDEIRVFSRDEKKQDDLRKLYSEFPFVKFIIGDVRDRSSLKESLNGVHYVFHAAALKQVPSCEYNVRQAILTNVEGAQNLVEAAIENGVEKVIAISTDKAVKPVNVMGMTKALQEKIMTIANQGQQRTVFACVRYGNVIGSRGSVIPHFIHLIRNHENLTITDYQMTRFVIKLDEAIDLVFKALELSIGGEIFVKKLPGIKIIDLAETMLEELDTSKQLRVEKMGVRPGEKIHEVLVSEEESLRTVEDEDYFVILPKVSLPISYQIYNHLNKMISGEYSSDKTTPLSKAEIRKVLQEEGWLNENLNHWC
ncbi:UDP-glucose 4-epimerase [Hydrogenispora ethanolica]|uniref:UDP-glucose 4-epimerase n=1 Tax=Hydrogenispora ethanolica TaxID=1082276 RepID=A0A4R1R493_HYDET|nr:polysaccharide biosynthesis protein [Hydrogenispora ethanolica]TCL60285.1 UDP-glucose 4-epimerase [Hydrogenispora ethanolica]